MLLGIKNAKRAFCGISSTGTIVMVLAFLSGLCFTAPHVVVGWLKERVETELCPAPSLASTTYKQLQNAGLAHKTKSTQLTVHGDSSGRLLMVYIPKTVSEEALMEDDERR